MMFQFQRYRLWSIFKILSPKNDDFCVIKIVSSIFNVYPVFSNIHAMNQISRDFFNHFKVYNSFYFLTIKNQISHDVDFHELSEMNIFLLITLYVNFSNNLISVQFRCKITPLFSSHCFHIVYLHQKLCLSKNSSLFSWIMCFCNHKLISQ